MTRPRFIIPMTALALIVGVSTADAGGRKSHHHYNKQVLANLNAQQQGQQTTNNVNIDQRQDQKQDHDYWWLVPGYVGATSNVAPSSGNYEGTRDYRITGPLGMGFSIPLAMHDEAAMYEMFAPMVLKTWSTDVVVTRDLMLDRAMQCQWLAGLEDILEASGRVCPE